MARDDIKRATSRRRKNQEYIQRLSNEELFSLYEQLVTLSRNAEPIRHADRAALLTAIVRINGLLQERLDNLALVAKLGKQRQKHFDELARERAYLTNGNAHHKNGNNRRRRRLRRRI
jgi:hypothetical protein